MHTSTASSSWTNNVASTALYRHTISSAWPLNADNRMMPRKTFLSLLPICLAALIYIAPSRAADDVAGDLIRFNSNGGWSWFEGEQAIIDSARGKILVSSVAN